MTQAPVERQCYPAPWPPELEQERTLPVDPFRVHVLIEALVQSLLLIVFSNCLDLDEAAASHSADADFKF